jgi:hypothetical protein
LINFLKNGLFLSHCSMGTSFRDQHQNVNPYFQYQNILEIHHTKFVYMTTQEEQNIWYCHVIIDMVLTAFMYLANSAWVSAISTTILSFKYE